MKMNEKWFKSYKGPDFMPEEFTKELVGALKPKAECEYLDLSDFQDYKGEKMIKQNGRE